jgi:hypothetical protein
MSPLSLEMILRKRGRPRHLGEVMTQSRSPIASRLLGIALVAIGAVAISEVPAGATPVPPNQVFNWSGACFDCSGTATGTLTLTGTYVLGTALNTTNFVSFHYNGTNLLAPFTINAGDAGLIVWGLLPVALPGPANVDIYNNTNQFASGIYTGGTLTNFCVATGGGFGGGTSCLPNDFGNASTFSVAPNAAVPEPASLALLGSGMMAFVVLRRRLRK